jgi:hypothetical protein
MAGVPSRIQIPRNWCSRISSRWSSNAFSLMRASPSPSETTLKRAQRTLSLLRMKSMLGVMTDGGWAGFPLQDSTVTDSPLRRRPANSGEHFTIRT